MANLIKNDRTLVGVFGYEGDKQQIFNNMPYYRHHRCPVVVFSPEDSKIPIRADGVSCRHAGKRAYVGDLSIERQRLQLRLMLTSFPDYQYFLLNDSDSVCLSPQIPKYLYDEDVFWSNEVSDMMHNRPAEYAYPRLAFQPPYFASRRILTEMVNVAPSVAVEQQTPFIDWCMMAWCVRAGLPHKTFQNGCSCPTAGYPPGEQCMVDMVSANGCVMCHSIKTVEVLRKVGYARLSYKKRYKL